MKKTISILFVAWFTGLQLFAQSDFKGRVIDIENKAPIEGAVIEIKGGNKNLLTDELGNFSFRANVATAKLFITSVGYITGEIELTNNEPALITLERGNLNLKEIALVSSGSTNSFYKIAGKPVVFSRSGKIFHLFSEQPAEDFCSTCS